MKLKLTKKGRVWRWEVRQGLKTLAGGYCATKKDATNDGGVWMRRNDQAHGAAGGGNQPQTH